MMRNKLLAAVALGLVAADTAVREINVIGDYEIKKKGKTNQKEKHDFSIEYKNDDLASMLDCIESAKSDASTACQDENGKLPKQFIRSDERLDKICIEVEADNWVAASDVYFKNCFEAIPPRALENFCGQNGGFNIAASAAEAIQCAVHKAASGTIRASKFHESQQYLAEEIDKFIATQDPVGNFVMSPVSIHMLTEMIFMGVDFSSDSSRQLWRALGYPSTGQNKTFSALKKVVKGTNLKTYIYSKVALNPEFETDIKAFETVINATMATLSGKEKPLNKLIEENTGGEIKDFFKPGTFTSDTMAVLLNTILFKEAWVQKFDGRTLPGKWGGTLPADAPRKQNGKLKNYNVNFMSTKNKGKFMVHTARGGGVYTTYLRLDFDNGQIMTIVMPYEPRAKTIEQYKKKAHEFTFADVIKKKDKMKEKTKKLRLPKFDFASEIDLKAVFQSMGVTDLFQSGKAKLNAMFAHDNNFHVSQFRHKATIKVDEKGAKASAVTAAVVVSKALGGSTTINIDQDFRFFIHDEKYKNVLFSGVVRTPTKATKKKRNNA